MEPPCFRGPAVVDSDDLPLFVEHWAAGTAWIRRRPVMHQAILVVYIEEEAVVQRDLQSAATRMSDDVGPGFCVDQRERLRHRETGMCRRQRIEPDNRHIEVASPAAI